jgi:hypothetical protein
MQQPNKYENNPLGLSPGLLKACEMLGRMFVDMSQKRAQLQKESEIIDTDYEVVEPKQLTENASNDGKQNS